jgi:beta-galactosidase
MTAWPEGIDGLCYGGDYNPEQWPRDVWVEDARLMREAGVNLVTVGVFSWAWLEPEEGRFEFGWLDEVLDLLHGHGVRVDLATATAAPPPWFSRRHPESLPVNRAGQRLWPGSRQTFCPSSAAYRAGAVRLAESLAKRYAGHPALALWHVHNEYGCHNAHCWCDASAEAFRGWLRRRYGDLDQLNHAWGTAFWSQRYGDWEEIGPPRLAPTFVNPTQQIDWWRFSSAELLECYRAEREVLTRHAPAIPVTTNFMLARFKPVDYWAWAPELDLVSNDHYLLGEDPLAHVDLALAGDLSRSLAGGAPWLLMEHSTSAVNWQARNLAKRPGQLRRNSLAHVARGADGVLFFQWRQSRAGAEKFHSGMVPHAGTGTRIWREVVELGGELERVAEVKGSRVDAEVALLWDWEAWWAAELDAHPSTDLSYLELVRDHHTALWRLGVTADLAQPGTDLERYRLVLAPSLYLLSDAAAANLRGFVEGGGSLLVQFFSGIVDQHDHVRPGGYPGALRELLGVHVEEFCPLPAGGRVRLDDGSTGSLWSEVVHAERAEVLARYADGPAAGGPAVTRNGSAWYVSTRLAGDDLQRLLGAVCNHAGVAPVGGSAPPEGVELVRRRSPGEDRPASWLFAINHGERPATVEATGVELLTGVEVGGRLALPGGAVAIVREDGA